MAKIITIVGSSGVGKTTLMRALCDKHNFASAYEDHQQRPFQELFKNDTRYALANQLDYLMVRAQQEQTLRADARTAIMDGGLDLDFYGFTRLFLTRGWLSEPEHDLCRRFYQLARTFLPSPELIIHLHADQKTVSQRLATRNRINIASEKDAQLLNQYIEEWLESVPRDQILKMDVSQEDIQYSNCIDLILKNINLKDFAM